MDEREFFEERAEVKKHVLVCPHCSQEGEYELNWLVRRKRAQLPRGADDSDKARFAKAQSYMLRRDDVLGCKNIRCRKRFEVTGVQSVAVLQESGPVVHGADREARLRAAFGRRSQG